MTEIIDKTTPESRRKAVEILLEELTVDAVFKPPRNQLGWVIDEEMIEEMKKRGGEVDALIFGK